MSDHAVACPKCGAPVIARIRRRKKAYLIELGLTLVFIVIMLFFVNGLLNKMKKDATTHPTEAQTTK